jgi:RNA polymerase sigma-70 factor, ECF subfamily
MAEGASIEVRALHSTVAAAAGGDELAFERIVAANHVHMARLAFLVVGDIEMAEDAVGRAWSIAWRRLPSLKDPSRLRPWLMSIAANEARQLARTERRRAIREITVARDPDASDRDHAALLDLRNALSRLDPSERALLGFRFVAGLDSTEIGQALGISASTARVRLSRLIARLREDLGDA